MVFVELYATTFFRLLTFLGSQHIGVILKDNVVGIMKNVQELISYLPQTLYFRNAGLRWEWLIQDDGHEWFSYLVEGL